MHCEEYLMSCGENKEKCVAEIKNDEVKIRLHRELKLSNVPASSVE